MTEGVRRGRRRVADGTGAAGPPQDTRVAWRLGVAALAGWVVLAGASGGLDTGRLPAGSSAAGLAWGLAVGAILALGAVVIARDARWDRTTAVGVAAVGGLVVWSALSIAWSIAPDLSWLASNRTALALVALVLGVTLGARIPQPAAALAAGYCAAATPILLWAIGSRAIADLLSPINDISRLAAPLGHPNGVALLTVLGVPGALLLAGTRRWREASAAWLALALTVLALTGSRSGVMALVVAVAIGVWWFPSRPAALAALSAGVAGAIIPVVYAMAGSDLTATPLPSLAERRTPGLVLGILVLTGMAIAVAIRGSLLPVATRCARLLDRRGAGAVLVVGTGAIVAGGALVAILGSRDAATDADRLLSTNHRWEWWQQAARGFTDAPLTGHGAGSFPFTNLLERPESIETLRVRQPHQLGLELLTEIGIVGFGLALVALVAVLVAARRAGRDAAPALAILAAFLVQAQLDIPWSFPALALPAMAAAGVILAMGARPQVRAGRGAGRVGVAAACALAALISGFVPWVAARRATDAMTAIAPAIGLSTDTRPDAATLAEASRRAARAADVNPLAVAPRLVEAQGWSAAGAQDRARDAARDATRRQPENPFAWQCLVSLTEGTERAEAQARWDRFDPRHDPNRPAACRPTS